jgi:hypothetical protein
MGKNQSASNITNIIRQDASGNIAFMSGSTMLMSLNNTGQMSGSAPAVSAVTASYADNFTVRGSLTAQTLVVQTITSSVDFVTGSTRFGTLLANTHAFTGSVSMTGSLAVVTNGVEFQVNSTGVNLGNALTDSHIISGSVRINPNGLFVSSSGNVGIGTTNPATKFDLSGSIGNFQIASSGAEVFLTRNDNNDILATGGTSSGITIGAQSYVRFSVGTSYTERMRINSAGNVGIGISPYAWNSIFIGFDFVNKGGVNSYTNYLSLSQNLYYGSDALDGWRYKTTGFGSAIHLESDSGDITFRSTGTSGTANGAATLAERMRIRSSGNVGINTSTFSGWGTNDRVFKIQGSAGVSVVQAVSSDAGCAVWLYSGASSSDDPSIIYAKDLRFGSATDLGTGGYNERMRITSGGNVGFGTSSPAALLTIKGRGGADIIFQMNDENNVRRCFYIPNQYYGYMWAVGVVSNGGKAFSFGNQDGTEVGTIVINSGGVAYNTTSDYRLKEDLKDFNGLEKVSAIKVYDFKWKNLNERTNGVLAHELAEVLPYAVSGVKDALNHEGKIEAQSVDYSKLTPVLVKAIQELNTKLDAANAEIEALKNK